MKDHHLHFNPALHGLRGLAAVLVMLFHWRTSFPHFANAFRKVPIFGQDWNLFFFIDVGWIGVHWFFVLSGYLLAGLLWTTPLNAQVVSSFWARRFFRIYPALWFQIFIMSVLTPYTRLLMDVDWHRYFTNVLLWLDPLPHGGVPYSGVWWTLPIEFSFYLCLPLVIWIYRKFGFVSMLVFALTVHFAWRLWVAGTTPPGVPINIGMMRLLPGSLWLFVAGAALNHKFPTVKARLWWPAITLGLAAYLLWLYIGSQTPRQPQAHEWSLYFWEPVMGVLIAAMIALLAGPTRRVDWLCSKPMVWLGTISYGIYLWHFPVLRLLPKVVPGTWRSYDGSWQALLICVVITLPLAAASYYWVERPALNWIGRRRIRAAQT